MGEKNRDKAASDRAGDKGSDRSSDRSNDKDSEAALDLNLLRFLVALDDEQSVSRAAIRLGVGQPRVSAALARLREHFDDALFVRTSRGMEPTPRSDQLLPVARQALRQIETSLATPRPFASAETKDTFRLALSDVGEIVFLPRLIKAFAEQAPYARLRSLSLPPAHLARALEAGDVDLAIGYFPDLGGDNFFQQRLFTHHFATLIRRDHPIQDDRLTLDQFIDMGHAVVRAEGRSQEVLESFLESRGIVRRAVLETPHFMSLPFILGRSDLIATVPHAIGLAYVRAHSTIRIVETSLDFPAFDLRQHWHRKYHQDPRLKWLRSVVTSLFNDQEDEWQEAVN